MGAAEDMGIETAHLSVAKVAKHLGRSKKQIRRWIDRGLFPNAWRPPGGQWSIPRTDVEALTKKFAARTPGQGGTNAE